MSSTNATPKESLNTEEEVMPGYKTVADFTKGGFKCLMEGIKHANSLPAGGDWNFYSTFEAFRKVLNEESHQLMNDMTSVLRNNEVGASMRNQTTEKKTEVLIDANDLILERVANNIDEMNGIRKSVNEPVILQAVSAQIPVNINGSWNRSGSATFSVSSTFSSGVMSPKIRQNTIRLLTGENIVRPQKLFKDKVDNRNDYPWEPRIKEKPNSLKPLAIFLEETDNRKEFSHPYEYELDRFTPTEHLLNKTKITKPKLLKDTPLVEINTPEQLPGLVNELRQFKAIAIDLEHHSYRSFMGITCLMQISTNEKDYLIDTLTLRNDLWVLNEVFTKNDITKVFHGADCDILWLQRDLSLYIVNMFDTHLAAKQLGYSGLSLSYLMQRFCNFAPDKHFQLADWRIRPLPEQLKGYAREDTHYLIYIYQNLRNELLDKANGKTNLLKAVIDSSTVLCKKRYFKPLWHENSHLEFYSRCHRMFDNKQLFALKKIYKWRDDIARIEDESTGYVLPNNMLLEIAGRLPKEMQGILACCSPVPPLVKANLLEIHKMILKALEKPFEEPILKEDARARGSTKKLTKINVDSPLHCPHDMTKNSEFRDNLCTLLNSIGIGNSNDSVLSELKLEQTRSICSVFNKPEELNVNKASGVSEKLRKFKENFKFLGPFERYKLVKPFIEAKEKRMAEERAKEEEAKTRKQVEEQGDNDNRTDEERIESIREHFLQLARKTLPPKKMSLLEMGGSKKRKRGDDSILLVNPVDEAPEKKLHTPIPNLQITVHTETNERRLNDEEGDKGGRKRKSSGSEEVGAGPSKMRKRSGREFNKMKMMRRKEKRAMAISNKANESSLLQIANSAEAGTSSSGARDPNRQSPHNRGRGRPDRRGRGRRGFRGKANEGFKGRNTHQQQRPEQAEHQDFNAYDYSMVDFRQFQGGARGVEKSKEFRTNFRGKPNKRGAKTQNRAMSFRGRGRGR